MEERFKMMKEIKGAIFDMDGVLFDSEALWQRFWKEAAEKRGIVLPEQFKKDICGSGGDLMNTVVKKYYQVEDGWPIMYEVFENLQNYLKEHYPDEKPGLHEILKDLKVRGFKIAVASSSTHEMIERNLTHYHVRDYFDNITSGTEVQHGKPAPDIFLLAAERLGLSPEECYVFEDAYNGIKAASAAGARPVMVVDQVEPDETISALCFYVAHSLTEADHKLLK